MALKASDDKVKLISYELNQKIRVKAFLGENIRVISISRNEIQGSSNETNSEKLLSILSSSFLQPVQGKQKISFTTSFFFAFTQKIFLMGSA